MGTVNAVTDKVRQAARALQDAEIVLAEARRERDRRLAEYERMIQKEGAR